MPSWTETFIEKVTGCLEFQDGLSLLESRYSRPSENAWGCHNIQIAPAWMEFVEGGASDGDRVYGLIWNWDLLAVQAAFTRLDGLAYSEGGELGPMITFEGTVGKRTVILELFTQPFDESDVGGEFLPDGAMRPT